VVDAFDLGWQFDHRRVCYSILAVAQIVPFASVFEVVEGALHRRHELGEFSGVRGLYVDCHRLECRRHVVGVGRAVGRVDMDREHILGHLSHRASGQVEARRQILLLQLLDIVLELLGLDDRAWRSH